MSVDARLALTLICYGIALVTELTGLVLVIREARRAGRALRRWQAANPAQNPQGALAQQTHVNEVVAALLGNPVDRWTAVLLLVVGVVVGGLGNFLSL
jgi:hypothetical protein